MGWFDFFKRKKVRVEKEKRMASEGNKVKRAFLSVKKDVTELQQRLSTFGDTLTNYESRQSSHSLRLEEHQRTLDSHSRILSDNDQQIREIILQIKELQSLKQSLILDQSKTYPSGVLERSKSVESETMKSKSKSAVKLIEMAERSILQNMKQIIKNEIYKIVEREGAIPLSRLQGIICDEKKFCSRASFFNYMKELRSEGGVENRTIDAQRVVIIAKSKKEKQIAGLD